MHNGTVSENSESFYRSFGGIALLAVLFSAAGGLVAFLISGIIKCLEGCKDAVDGTRPQPSQQRIGTGPIPPRGLSTRSNPATNHRAQARQGVSGPGSFSMYSRERRACNHGDETRISGQHYGAPKNRVPGAASRGNRTNVNRSRPTLSRV